MNIYYIALMGSAIVCIGYFVYLLVKNYKQNKMIDSRSKVHESKNGLFVYNGYHKENSPILEEPYHQVVTEGEELLNTEDSGSFILDDSIIQGGEYFVCWWLWKSFG